MLSDQRIWGTTVAALILFACGGPGTDSTNFTLVPTDLPSAVITQPYQAVLRTTNGSAAYNWDLASGLLPDGVTLINRGDTAELSGTPLAPGIATIFVRVVDGQNRVAIERFVVTVFDLDPTGTPIPPPGSNDPPPPPPPPVIVVDDDDDD